MVNELTIPKEVESAKKYVDECERDMDLWVLESTINKRK
jgi:hypothetical protein